MSRLRNSFLSRAATALSLTSLILSNLPGIVKVAGIELWPLRLLLVGSLVFLTGYVLFGFLAPHEFRQPGEIHDHVQRMRHMADQAFIRSRQEMAGSLLKRMQKMGALQPPIALTAGLENKLEPLHPGADMSIGEAAGLFRADLALREHDRPVFRLIVAVYLGIGIVFLVLPTLWNLFSTIRG